MADDGQVQAATAVGADPPFVGTVDTVEDVGDGGLRDARSSSRTVRSAGRRGVQFHRAGRGGGVCMRMLPTRLVVRLRGCASVAQGCHTGLDAEGARPVSFDCCSVPAGVGDERTEGDGLQVRLGPLVDAGEQ